MSGGDSLEHECQAGAFLLACGFGARAYVQHLTLCTIYVLH